MSFVSLFSNTKPRPVLLVGSGARATATLRRLVDVGARVRWFSQDLDVAEEIWLSGEPSRIELTLREPRALDFEEAAAVIATLGEPLARRVSEQARAAGCPVSVIGRPDLSTLDLDAECDEESDRADGPGSPPSATLGRLRSWLSAYLSRAMPCFDVSLPRSFGI
jgi:siroheme synthase (precorrin-2 oxidase/ferrochelatase)